MSGHSVASLGARHPLHNWEYADATTREAATGFVAADVGKAALQLDNSSAWVLVDNSPVTWKSLTEIGSLIGVDSIQYNTLATPSHIEGQTHWTDEDKTMEIDTEVSGVSIQVGQESVVRVTNSTGDTLDNGIAAYINGATGQRPTVQKAIASAPVTSKVIGVLTHSLSNGNTGYVTTFGLVRDIDTSAYSAGAYLYLSATVAGGYQTTAPTAPNIVVRVAIVLYSHATEGKIFICPVVSTSIAELGPGTLAQLNSAISDATLDDASSARPPSITENLDMGGFNIANVGAVDGRDVSADGGTLDSHVGSTSNPHSTSIANIGSGTLDQLNTALSDATIPDCDTSGNVDMGNQDILNAKTVTFNSVPVVTPSAGTLTCEFDEYQKIVGNLNNNASVTIQLNVPKGPGNFMLVLLQGASTPTTTITWATEGTHALYSPDGVISVQSGVGQYTLIGLFYDGSTWFATASPMSQVLSS